MTEAEAGSTEQAGTAGGGILYIVSTPIGNLGDITLRALEVLRSVPLVAAEDTRMTRRLWARYGMETRLVSHHAQSPPARLDELIAHLAGGADLAVVTDAGTPLVSDPGDGLVARWAAREGRVVPIPGASAVLAALVASGIAAPRWSFEGFLPRRGPERRERLGRIAADERATVLFEAPPRTAATLRDLVARCGAERPAALCRELTKLHEEIQRGTLASLAAGAAASPPRGEVTIVVAGRDPVAADGTPPAGGDASAVSDPDDAPETRLAEARAEVERLVGEGMRRPAAAREVARRTGLSRRALFVGDLTRED